MKLPSSRSLGLLVLCIAVPLIIGIIGSVFTMPEVGSWYAGLNKPSFNPPAWLFGPVWTLLYILMGISLWLVIKDGMSSRPVQQAVALFAVQLGLNLAWSIIFFGLHLIAVAFIEILVLDIFIVATMLAFRRINPTAGWLFIPYICWTAFASVLTGTLWLIN